MTTSNDRLSMFCRRFPLAIGLFCFLILFIIIWVFQTSENVAVTTASNMVNSGQRWENKRSRNNRSKNVVEKIATSDADKITFAHHAVVNVQFSTKIDEAESKLKEELNFLYTLPPSHERSFLLSFLIKAYTQATFEASPSKEELLDRMQRFGAIINKLAAGKDIERLLISASEQCAKMIGALPRDKADILRTYLESQGTMGNDHMGARIAASFYVGMLKSSAVPDHSLIDRINNINVRRIAEQTFMRTFDFGKANEKVVETFATRYLSNNNINSDHEIAVRLFGIGLQRYPEAISTIILNTPPSQKKDEAIEQMIFRIALGDLERATLWWEQIQDANIKKRAEIDISGKRERGNPNPMPVADPAKDPFQ